jgi:cysteine desulfurase
MVAMGGIATKSGAAGVYLDHAATTPMRPEALAAMAEAAALGGNPASVHAAGRAANAVLERARDTVAGWAGVAPEQVIFTSGGTEALRLTLAGAAPPRRLVLATEHSAVLGAAADAEIIPVTSDGLIDLAALEAMLAGAPALVAAQAANNETGVVQPLAEVAALVAQHGGLLLADAVQSAGKRQLPDADFIAVSAHKLGGPPGAGALIVRSLGLLPGGARGGQEQGLRPGTPNLPGIAGFAAAVALPRTDWTAVKARRERLEAALMTARPDAVIAGAAAPRLPNIINIALPGASAMMQVMALDLAGFMVSAGAACSSGKVGPSHVLAAMGLGAAAGEAIRVSLGPDTSDAEIDAFIAAWTAMAERLSPRRAAA